MVSREVEEIFGEAKPQITQMGAADHRRKQRAKNLEEIAPLPLLPPVQIEKPCLEGMGNRRSTQIRADHRDHRTKRKNPLCSLHAKSIFTSRYACG